VQKPCLISQIIWWSDHSKSIILFESKERLWNILRHTCYSDEPVTKCWTHSRRKRFVKFIVATSRVRSCRAFFCFIFSFISYFFAANLMKVVIKLRMNYEVKKYKIANESCNETESLVLKAQPQIKQCVLKFNSRVLHPLNEMAKRTHWLRGRFSFSHSSHFISFDFCELISGKNSSFIELSEIFCREKVPWPFHWRPNEIKHCFNV